MKLIRLLQVPKCIEIIIDDARAPLAVRVNTQSTGGTLHVTTVTLSV